MLKTIRWTATVINNLGSVSLNYTPKAFEITPKKYTIFVMKSSYSTTFGYTRLIVAQPIEMKKHSDVNNKPLRKLRT